MKKKFDKKEFKRKTLKLINIICYILSGLFLLLCVVAGCKSCKKHDNSRLDSSKMQLNINNVNYQYTLLNNPNFESESYNVGESQFNWVDYYFDNAVHNVQLGNQEIYLNDFGYYYNDYGTPLKINFVKLSFNEIHIGNLYRFYFDRLDIEYEYVANGGGYTTDYVGVVWNDNDYDVYYFNKDDFAFDLYAVTQYNCPILSYFYYLDLQTDFVFNNQINYNSPLGLNLDSFYGPIASGMTTTSVGGYIVFDTGLFISNNSLYDAIRWDVVTTDGLLYDYDGTIKVGPSAQYSYVFLMYRKYGTSEYDIVNVRNTKDYSSGSAFSKYQLSSSTWQNQNYRYVTFLQNLNNDTRTKIEKFNNNGLSTGFQYGGDIGDVFSILTTAFTGVIPFLSVTILPGISLGILLFIPLVVVIIFAIIRIMHK